LTGYGLYNQWNQAKQNPQMNYMLSNVF